MLEERNYKKAELAAILGTKENEGIKRKLERYDIEFIPRGRGKDFEIDIIKIHNPFKVYCITVLGLDAKIDFDKLCLFLYYFLNVEDYCWLPDEVIEERLEVEYGAARPSRQTIGKWRKKLEERHVIHASNDFIYYFAFAKRQILTDKATYCKAWREYFEIQKEGHTYDYAITSMIVNYGGVARKQAISAANAFYFNELNKLVTERIA